jgi:UDP-N-acetylglucosamine 2-epimerase
MVLVHGDTSSALMAALAAFYQQIPVAHVEAGLRSHNEYNPFPEEKNRTLIAKLAHWHFAPTLKAKQNLLADGVIESAIYQVGNTIVEAAQMGVSKLDNYRKIASKEETALLDQLATQINGKKMILVTVHRRENQEQNIARIAKAVLDLLTSHDDMIAVWPVHPNPVVKNAVYGEIEKADSAVAARLYMSEPLDYPALLWVLKNSWITLTDSGGIQEEAVALGTPVLVLRETTERPEVIEAGAGLLIGADPKNIVACVDGLYANPARHKEMCHAKNPFGDGTTAKQICNILLSDTTRSSYAQAV